MGDLPDVLWTGNLATPRRTVLGVFGHIARSGMDEAEVLPFLLECGIPPIAIDEPDIPITHDQQLVCIARLLERVDPGAIPHHALDVGLDVRITSFGVLGLALMHAKGLGECFRVVTSYPELSWGHSRIAVGLRGGELFESYVLDARFGADVTTDVDALRHYCITIDLTATTRMVVDLLGSPYRPTRVWLPYPAPTDRRRFERLLGCPVRFDAPEARVFYPASIWRATPLLANPLLFRVYDKLCDQLARQLRTDIEISEQVRRALWVSSPPPDRDSVASMVGVSPRTLARKLAAEGTSYGELQQEVRLSRARELLSKRTLQIGEIADRLGFSDATAFSRAFRTWTGESPSSFRTRRDR